MIYVATGEVPVRRLAMDHGANSLGIPRGRLVSSPARKSLAGSHKNKRRGVLRRRLTSFYGSAARVKDIRVGSKLEGEQSDGSVGDEINSISQRSTDCS